MVDNILKRHGYVDPQRGEKRNIKTLGDTCTDLRLTGGKYIM